MKGIPGLESRVIRIQRALHFHPLNWYSLLRLGAIQDGRTLLVSELIFIVEEAAEGGYLARALGASIFTEADDWQELQTRFATR